MSMAYIRDHYRVPAKRGARIRFDCQFAAVAFGTEGTIVGSRGQYLRVRLDGHPVTFTLHPMWKVDYLGQARTCSHDEPVDIVRIVRGTGEADEREHAKENQA